MTTEDVLGNAIELVKAEKKAEAQKLLEPYIEANPQDVIAWLWEAETWPSTEKKIKVLEMCLEHNPDNQKIRQALAALNVQKIIQSLKEFVFGFLGWFIFANIAFLAIAILMISLIPSINGFFFVLVGIWVPTAIALMVLFSRKRTWRGIGILAAIACNTIIIGITLPFTLAILTPIPSTYGVYMFIIMDAISPPYSDLNNLADLFKIVSFR
jgi:hypothetical protein